MSTTETQSPAPMQAEPQAQHQWLHRLIGDWTFQAEAMMGPDKPSEKASGAERVRSIGGLWILAEGEGEMPCDAGHATTIMTLGYDPRTGRFVGTWLGSMMTHLWVYDGQLDANERVLTLSADGPDFQDPGKLRKYRDVLEIIDEDHRTLSGYMLTDDGSWQQLMKAHYRRR